MTKNVFNISLVGISLTFLLTYVSCQLAGPCDPSVCVLPDCYCGGEAVPGGLRREDIPQFVLLTFDDAVNGLNQKFFQDLFKNRFNPNGCPIKVLTKSILFQVVSVLCLKKWIFLGNILRFARMDGLFSSSKSLCRWPWDCLSYDYPQPRDWVQWRKMGKWGIDNF